MLLTSLLLLTLNSLVLLVSLLWLTYFLLVVFPSVLASLDVPVVSCAAFVPPDAVVLSSSLELLLWLESLLWCCAAHIGMGGVKIEKEPRQVDEYVYRIS